MKQMPVIVLLALSSLTACGGGTPEPVKPVTPPPGSLYSMVSTPKNVATGKIATKPDEFWLDKGSSKQLVIDAKRLSPLAKKLQIEASVSGSHLSITPTVQIVSATGTATFTVTIDSSFNVGVDPNPYFFLYGVPLGDNDQKLADQIRLDYGWDIQKPPVVVP